MLQILLATQEAKQNNDDMSQNHRYFLKFTYTNQLVPIFESK